MASPSHPHRIPIGVRYCPAVSGRLIEEGDGAVGFGDILAQMLVLCVPIAIGLVARKLDLMSDETNGAISRLVLNVTLPCLLIASVGSAGELPEAGVVLSIVGYGFLGYLLAIAMAYAVPALMRSPRGEAGAYRFMIVFGNVGFIGYPVVSAIFGPGAVLYAAIANIPCNLFMYSLGIAMVRGSAEEQKAGGGASRQRLPLRRRLRRMLADVANPTFIASLAVLALVLLGVDDLGLLGDGLSLVGQFTTPAALLVVGASLAQYRLRDMVSNWRAYVVAACRLLAVPLLVLLLLGGFLPEGLARGVLVVGFAMPVASNGVLFSLLYGADVKPMMQGTFISIAASVLTIPLVALLV